MQIIIEIPTMLYLVLKLDGVLGYPRLTEIIRNGTPLPKGHEMREATPEELESVNNYIKSISKPTGVNIWDEIEEGDNRCR